MFTYYSRLKHAHKHPHFPIFVGTFMDIQYITQLPTLAQTIPTNL